MNIADKLHNLANECYMFNDCSDQLMKIADEIKLKESKPCPICGNDDDYLRFLDLCAKRANEIWHENEIETLAGMYKAMDFVQVVRCRDCKHFTPEGTYKFSDGSTNADFCEYLRGWLRNVNPNGFCAWGEQRES